MLAIHEEREALAQNVQQERSSIVAAMDVQRASMTKDAERIAAEITLSSWRHVHTLVREIALYSLLGIIVVLGAPFAAGYFVGRAVGAWRPNE